MSSAAALPSVKLRKLSLQEQANIQTIPQSNDKHNITFLAFWGLGKICWVKKKLENWAFW